VFGIIKKKESNTEPSPSKKPPTGEQDKKLKKPFPLLGEYGNPVGMSPNEIQTRRKVLSELIQYNEKNGLKHSAQIASHSFRLIRIPLTNRSRGEFDENTFLTYCQKSGVMEGLIESFAKYCDGTEDDSAALILHYFAKKFPSSYVKHVEMAQNSHKKKQKNNPDPISLPPDYVNHDGTEDHGWNLQYMELIKYKNEHGNCLVPIRGGENGLGKWVCTMREKYKVKLAFLTPRRLELLESIGFAWVADPTRKAIISGGDPCHCRAMAAKIVYPILTIREALYLGGYNDEEMDIVKDAKHKWRTGYTVLKDKMNHATRHFDSARKVGAKNQIEKLVGMLKSDAEDRLEQVFGECSSLLAGFLQAAEERERNCGTERPKQLRKRSSKEADLAPGEVEQPVRKQSRVDPAFMDLESTTAMLGESTQVMNHAADCHQTTMDQLLWRLGC
jgi:hypothetical protein